MIFHHARKQSDGLRSCVLPSSLCVVPFSSGANQVHRPDTFLETTRKDCLRQAVSGACRYFEQIFVTTANRYDFTIAGQFGDRVTPFLLSEIPSREMLSCFSLLILQDLLQKGSVKASFICYNEFDNELFFEDVHTDAALLDPSLFISPVIVENFSGRNRDVPGIPIVYRGQKCFAHTGGPGAGGDAVAGGRTGFSDSYYVPKKKQYLSSNTWLCTTKLFSALPFVDIMKNTGHRPRLPDISPYAYPIKSLRWNRCFARRLHQDIIYRKVACSTYGSV